jgi:hypothetical protein
MMSVRLKAGGLWLNLLRPAAGWVVSSGCGVDLAVFPLCGTIETRVQRSPRLKRKLVEGASVGSQEATLAVEVDNEAAVESVMTILGRRVPQG